MFVKHGIDLQHQALLQPSDADAGFTDLGAQVPNPGFKM